MNKAKLNEVNLLMEDRAERIDLYAAIYKLVILRTRKIAETKNAEPAMEEQIRRNAKLLLQIADKVSVLMD